MWGTCSVSQPTSSRKRFIPTYVGNINSTTNRMTPVTVHPHVCGEHSRSPERWVTCPGSSPRMWGTYPLRRVFSFEVRFIPTYVGNINSVDQAGFGPPVHPHVCGEHSATLKGSVKPIGSSPRMWGTYCRTPSRRTTTRFIPTYVGNIHSFATQRTTGSVHPHVCGEHFHHGANQIQSPGSSPRMWGTWRTQRSGNWRLRFIPTYVGNISGSAPLH